MISKMRSYFCRQSTLITAIDAYSKKVELMFSEIEHLREMLSDERRLNSSKWRELCELRDIKVNLEKKIGKALLNKLFD